MFQATVTLDLSTHYKRSLDVIESLLGTYVAVEWSGFGKTGTTRGWLIGYDDAELLLTANVPTDEGTPCWVGRWHDECVTLPANRAVVRAYAIDGEV